MEDQGGLPETPGLIDPGDGGGDPGSDGGSGGAPPAGEASAEPQTGDGARVAELAAARQARVEELEDELREALAALARAERKTEIDAVLLEAGAVDLDTARLVVESELSAAGDLEVGAAVATLRATKPFLFRSSEPATAGMTFSAAPFADAPDGQGLDEIAASARETGDRRELLRYLRLRRGA